jgi:amino acid transporter
MATVMGVLVLSSLFAGILAFQNSASRYFFALSRGGALPRPLARVNRYGAPGSAALLTSLISGAVMLVFAVGGLDPILNLFFWFSGLAVVSIVLIEILVCVAVIVYFHMHPGDEGVFTTKIAPALATVGLVLGVYLLMSRFALLAGTVADGMDPTTTPWAMNTLGWSLVLLPFAVFALGFLYSLTQGRKLDALVSDVLN